MLRYYFFILLSMALLSGCGSKSLLQDSSILNQKKTKQQNKQPKQYYNKRFEYRIQPHDRVQVTVYNHPELSTATGMGAAKGVLVDSRGIIHLSLISEVHIGGLTQSQAAHKIEARYGRYLKKSNVHLEVLDKKAFILGEVKTPGIVKLPNEQTTLLQAIATVGGFKDYANKEQLVILRKSGRGTKAEVVDLTNLTSLSQSGMMIYPGDVIYVAPTGMKDISVNIAPIFKMVADALLPFVRIQDL